MFSSLFKRKSPLSSVTRPANQSSAFENIEPTHNAPAGTVEISREKNGNHKYNTLRNAGRIYYRVSTKNGKKKILKSGRGKQFNSSKYTLLGRYTRKENSNEYNVLKAEWNAKMKEYLNAKEKRIENAKQGKPPQGYQIANEKTATHFQYQDDDDDIYIEEMPDYSDADNSYQQKLDAWQKYRSFEKKQQSPLFRYLEKKSQEGGKTRKQKKSKKSKKTRKH